MIRSQLILDVHDELIVDNFAGGGGASTAIEIATGRHVDHAANHDLAALGMHRINHAQTVHHCQDIFDIYPSVICGGRCVALAHFSPDCKHFSKAKGGQPLDKRIRGLVLVMLRWAKYGARVMTMENVEEIRTWGPLKRMLKNGEWGMYPDPAHRGRTWLAFLACLGEGIKADHPDLAEILEVLDGTVTKDECVRGFGYRYEYREIRACDYGSPTIRKRLFMVARNDWQPIVWPEPTHFDTSKPGNKRKRPWRTIAECIDWGLPCPSIFLTKEQARASRCKRPLAKATLRRIATGMDKHVLRAKRPFLVNLTHQGGDRVESIDEPGKTITGAHRGEKAVVSPVVTRTDMHQSNAGCAFSPEEPIRTITSTGGFGSAEASLAPFVTEHANSNKATPHWPADHPLRTQCAEVKGGHFAMVAGSLTRFNGDHPDRGDGATRNQSPEVPLTTQDTSNRFGVVTGTLVHTAHGEQDSKGKKRGRGEHSVSETMPTVLASPDGAIASATLVGAGGRAAQSRPRGVDEPSATGTAKADTCIASASMVKLRGTNVGDQVDAPLHTVSAGGTHHGIVAAHMTKFNTGAIGSEMSEPIPTIPAGSHSPETHGGAATPHGMVTAFLAQQNGGFNETPGHPAEAPLSTISATGSQQNVVTGCAVAYYGNDADGQSVSEPARTVTTKDRLGHVECPVVYPLTEDQLAGARRVAAFLREHGIQFEGEFATVAGYVIVDIGLRMLTPRELFRAQGFPESYVIDRAWVVDPETGAVVEIRLTKEQQIRMCGNSVCPQPYAAIVRANVPELCIRFGDERKELVSR